MSAPTDDEEDGESSEDSTEAVSAEEALDILPTEEEFEAEFNG